MTLDGKPCACVWRRQKGTRTLPRGLAQPDDWITFANRRGAVYGAYVARVQGDTITVRDPVDGHRIDVARQAVIAVLRPGNPLDSFL